MGAIDKVFKPWLSSLYNLSGQSYLIFFVLLMLTPFIAPILFHSEIIVKLLSSARVLCIILWQLALNHCMGDGRYYKSYQTLIISLCVIVTASLSLIDINIPDQAQSLIQFFVYAALLFTQIKTAKSIHQHLSSNDFGDTTLAILFKIWMFPFFVISLQTKLHEIDIPSTDTHHNSEGFEANESL